MYEEAKKPPFQKVEVCAETDIGHTHRHNEDNYLIVDHTSKNYDVRYCGMMFAVADGISGHAEGATASNMACKGLLDYYAQKVKSTEEIDFVESRLKRLEEIVLKTDHNISQYSSENKRYEHMGTTLSALLLVSDAAVIAHVGDSRIYRLQNDYLQQLTEDHTMAQLSVEMGYLDPEEVSKHPQRHVLIQAVGEGVDEVQTKIATVRKGDIFMLCTDGLYNMVSDEKIKEILSANFSHGTACYRLVRTALSNGGRDNVSVIVVQIQSVS